MTTQPGSYEVPEPVAVPTDYPTLAMHIDGRWTDGSGDRREAVINPATGARLGSVPLAEKADLDAALAAAARGYRIWRDTPVERRSRILRRAADLLRERAPQIGRVMTLEQGKALAEAVGEVQRVATLLDWDCEEGRRAYGRIIPTGPGETLTVRREPIGPVAAFTPWNFPAGSPMRKIAAALSAGCSIVIKASEEVPATACALVRCFEEAGVPAGVLNLVFGVPAEVSEHLVASPTIRFVAFTGSVPVGKKLAGLAAAVMKPTIMELGGHAPVIICDDVDPAAAAAACARGKYTNAGQVCTSPSRFFVHDSIHDEFVDALVKASEAVVVGDGLAPGVQMGPLANERRRAAVRRLVDDARDRGAAVLTGGEDLPGPGFFYRPTLLADVPADAEILRDEPFGPVAPVIRFRALDDAIAQANALPYGLAAYGFTHRADTVARLTDAFEAGILSINHVGGSVPQAPSGGFKESGHGREGGSEGLDGYLVTKRVSHRLAI
ncbi:NAD-dependent succinate-semialdehyde dehydrogenase [Frankia sp. CcI49]|uniref:NAD-dependent succinate-semialdehyde dehydrogenase n=1 Tax=Frankia sp. CcI49 TaxID=1745382 RepID=UPI0009753A3C|nr:NAD-dependent succinate-semialdehyde dehydrogenase [Frankia sp. CcI49]ONH61465.1 NAD-dependent succinate-semialdehyde dehydrogenase [Frankia sp. CcI49]